MKSFKEFLDEAVTQMGINRSLKRDGINTRIEFLKRMHKQHCKLGNRITADSFERRLDRERLRARKT
jgi:hypothetical protein